jgi:hypothetical protein
VQERGRPCFSWCLRKRGSTCQRTWHPTGGSIPGDTHSVANLYSGIVDEISARYFQAADHQLSSEIGEIRLTSVQARLCQCFFLLSRSRVNHCWSLFGTTARLILAIGIHRKRRVETSNGVDLVDLECRKRVFWCAYGLDNYLSAALGRPRTFHDEDIDQVRVSFIQIHIQTTEVR